MAAVAVAVYGGMLLVYILLSLEQWEILGTHVTLAGVQFRDKSPLLGEPGVAIRAMSHQWCS